MKEPEEENLDDQILDEEIEWNQAYLRNKKLPRSDTDFKFTPAMVAEMEKCREDILHFATNYFYITNIDEGVQKIKLYPAQKRILKALQKNRFVVLSAARQSGKCFGANTLLKLRNKKTGEILEITANDFWNIVKDLK